MNRAYLKIRILIADDHEMIREGLRIMINKIDELEIVGEATNGLELIDLTRKLRPDVVLADVKMPHCGGVDATRQIKTEFPHIGVVALSSFDETGLIMDMLNAGAKGYLLKNAGKDEITEAVKAVYRDEPYYCRDVNLKLSRMIAKGGTLEDKKKNFTERELEVIRMICEEYSSKQIAGRLNLKARTIERYRDAIMFKMGVKNTAGVVKYAIENGLYTTTETQKDAPS